MRYYRKESLKSLFWEETDSIAVFLVQYRGLNMSLEKNFFIIKENGTVPLKLNDPQNVISQLLKNGVAQLESESYFYRELRIRKQAISIFVSTSQDE